MLGKSSGATTDTADEATRITTFKLLDPVTENIHIYILFFFHKGRSKQVWLMPDFTLSCESDQFGLVRIAELANGEFRLRFRLKKLERKISRKSE